MRFDRFCDRVNLCCPFYTCYSESAKRESSHGLGCSEFCVFQRFSRDSLLCFLHFSSQLGQSHHPYKLHTRTLSTSSTTPLLPLPLHEKARPLTRCARLFVSPPPPPTQHGSHRRSTPFPSTNPKANQQILQIKTFHQILSPRRRQRTNFPSSRKRFKVRKAQSHQCYLECSTSQVEQKESC